MPNQPPPGVKPQQLKVLEAVIRRRSFTGAARELKMSQPAISQHMRALEDACGVRLVERVGNTMRPTPSGSALYTVARQLSRVERDLTTVVAGLGAGLHGSITVAGNTTGGMYLVPRVVKRFRAQFPEVDIQLVITGTPSILDQIIEGTVDTAIVGGPIDPKRFDVRTLCLDELIPVVAPGHRLASRSTLSVEDLVEEPLIVPSPGSTTRAAILQRFREERVHMRIGMEFDATESIKKAVESQLGVAVISRWAIGREIAAGVLVPLNVEGFPIPREYQLVTRRWTGSLPPSVDRFLETAQAMSPELVLDPR